MEDVEIRLSPDEGMYLINCTAKEAETLLALTDDGAETLFETPQPHLKHPSHVSATISASSASGIRRLC